MTKPTTQDPPRAADTGTMPASALFPLYNGRGERPSFCAPLEPTTRGERGRYLADRFLVDAVRTAIALERPLLLLGEPGTGKTTLAWSIAYELDLGKVLTFHARSDHRARDLFYTFDPVRRFYHAQVRDARAEDAFGYLTPGPLGQAICGGRRRVVLIDEIDKAPRDFPADLLDALDRMSFTIDEVDPNYPYDAAVRPIVVITSNRDKQLPDPFLRRCVFHFIRYPDRARLREILNERLGPELDAKGALGDELVQAALERHGELREMARRGELERPPGTDELVVWVKVLLLAGVPVAKVKGSALRELPHVGALLKSVKDHERIEQQAAERQA